MSTPVRLYYFKDGGMGALLLAGGGAVGGANIESGFSLRQPKPASAKTESRNKIDNLFICFF